ncbi:MAG: hypothetical protein OXN16_13330 [Gammaproteobacteria bacterium]|nr:hypothetical protein [Gammaproteobacteria bacterium]
MPAIVDILGRAPEPRPEWLCAQEALRFDRDAFFKSRTVYYPGSGNDGQPVKFCALSRAAHSFVHVDQSVGWEALYDRLVDPEQGFRGYGLAHHEKVTRNDLRPGGWTPHISKDETWSANKFADHFVRPFAHFAVLERRDGDGSHGPRRLAFLFIGGDGIASYDALYCQEDGTPPPFLAVIRDSNGFGMNYGRFDRDGLLDRIARRTGVLPEFLLVADSSIPWAGYADTGADAEPGGSAAHPGRLYRRECLNNGR